MADVPRYDVPSEHDVHISEWDLSWFERYAQQNYVECDPILKEARSNFSPFFWSDIANAPNWSPREKLMMDEAKYDFGMKNGLCVPLYGPKGLFGVISIASSCRRWRLSQRQRWSLQLVCHYAYEKVWQHDKKNNSSTMPQLTPRETECIKWLADGKTAWEIGKILGMAEDTVRQHLKTASRKLDVHSRTQLAVLALKLGLI